jgi:hypothetical protein
VVGAHVEDGRDADGGPLGGAAGPQGSLPRERDGEDDEARDVEAVGGEEHGRVAERLPFGDAQRDEHERRAPERAQEEQEREVAALQVALLHAGANGAPGLRAG